jgi:hypothetical protein
MANRPPALDPLVFSIRDLENYGSENLSDGFQDYYNGGAMDMITYICTPASTRIGLSFQASRECDCIR